MRMRASTLLLCLLFASVVACRPARSVADQNRAAFTHASGLRLTGCALVTYSDVGSNFGATVHYARFVVPETFDVAWLNPAREAAVADWNEEIARREAHAQIPLWNDEEAARGEHFYAETTSFRNYYSYDSRTHSLYWIGRMVE